MYLILITIFGFVLRLINIIKPEGLWNDEYVSWMIAATPLKEGFFTEIFKQCHMPLYYLYLKPFSSYGDLVLRLSSVLPSVIAIWVMYLVGKEYSKKIGLLSATLTAILPFLIYYSQEVRLYSLTFLLSSLLLLFTVKILKNNDKRLWILYFITALILVFTHILGIIFVFYLTIYLLIKNKSLNVKSLSILLGIIVLALPIIFNIIKQIPSAQWWGVFSYTNILFLFTDFLSPILTNNINAPHTFFYNANILFLFLLLIPTILSLVLLFSVLKKFKGYLLVVLCTVITVAIFAVMGKLVFITKYLIEVLPIFILIIAYGTDYLKKTGIIIFSLISIIYMTAVFTPFYPSKKFRSEGNNLPAYILNIENPDKIIYTYYAPDRFTRYLKTKSETLYISKINRFEYLNNPEKILSNIKNGEKVSLVFLDSVSFIPKDKMEYAKKHKFPEMFITFSQIKISLINYFNKNYKNKHIKTLGAWTVISGEKL